jgi:hypothetical protein
MSLPGTRHTRSCSTGGVAWTSHAAEPRRKPDVWGTRHRQAVGYVCIARDGCATGTGLSYVCAFRAGSSETRAITMKESLRLFRRLLHQKAHLGVGSLQING